MSEEEARQEATQPDETGVVGDQEAAEPRDELAAAQARADEYLRHWQRAQADFVNYKRRTQQEQEQTLSFANAELLRQMLPVLDDFHRAMAAHPALSAPDEAAWAQGITSIVRKLEDTLARNGLQPIESVGTDFDPNEHEAILNVEAPPEMDGKVTAEARKGYKLRDRVLRPAQVIVGKVAEAP